MRTLVKALAAAAAALLCSCALLSKSEPNSPQYFTPAPSSLRVRQAAATPLGAHGQLRLGRITSSSYLREWSRQRAARHPRPWHHNVRIIRATRHTP